MHELSIAQAIVDEVVAVAARQHSGTVAVVNVDVGALSGVEPDALDMVFPFASGGTPIAGASLKIRRVPARVQCNSCRKKVRPEFPFLVCPACGSDNVQVLSGRDMVIRSIEFGKTSGRHRHSN